MFEKPTPLLFFEAVTLHHVREPDPSDGQEAMTESQHRAWGESWDWLLLSRPPLLGEVIENGFFFFEAVT